MTDRAKPRISNAIQQHFKMKNLRKKLYNYLFSAEIKADEQEKQRLEKANKAVVAYVVAVVKKFKKEYGDNFRCIQMCQEIDQSLTWINKDFKGTMTWDEIRACENEVQKLVTKSESKLRTEINELKQALEAHRRENNAIREFLQADENESTYDEVVRKFKIIQKQK